MRRRLAVLGCLAVTALAPGGEARVDGGEALVSPRHDQTDRAAPALAPPRLPFLGRFRSATADVTAAGAWSAPLPSALYDSAEQALPAAPGPATISIPAIDADAPVRPVGVLPDGGVEVPPPDVVGWYRFGSIPGEAGSTVLVGHVAFDGVDGAFRHLADLSPGDEVRVDDRTFVVVAVDEYRKNALPGDVWTDQGRPRLVLITCGGSFDAARRSYDSNVVVWAEPA
jgi:hypothetical protein